MVIRSPDNKIYIDRTSNENDYYPSVEEQDVSCGHMGQKGFWRKIWLTSSSHYYQSKDDLLEEALLLALADLEQDWQFASDETNLARALRTFSYSHMPIDGRLGRKWSAWQVFVRKKGRYGKVARKLVYLQRENRRKLSSLLKRGQELGVIRTDIAIDELVDLWSATLNGYGRLSPFMVSKLSKRRVNNLVDTQLRLFRDCES